MMQKCRQMILNAFAKLAARYPDLRGIIQSVFEVSSEHFDPDLQQRGVEYNALLNEPQNVQQIIFSKQPPFSLEIQGDSSLLKRIYKLKMGSKQETKDTYVALENQRRAQEQVDFLTKSTGAQGLSNAPKSKVPLNTHIENLKNNLLYEINPNSVLVSGSNLVSPPPSLQNFSNINQVKTLLSTMMGQVLDTNELVIQYKSDYQQHMGKIAMQFESKVGRMENVNFTILNQDQNGLDFNISPIKYDENPQIMMQVMSTDPRQLFPTASLTYDVNGQQKRIEFTLPIITNKFNQRVDMPQDAFDKFWTEYSQSSNSTSYKLDAFISNPAGVNVAIHDVLKKAGGLLNSVLNLKVMAIPDMNNIATLYGVGQFAYKDIEKNATKNLPVMIQIEGSEVYKEHMRLSLRGAGSPFPISNMYQIITCFMGIDG